MTQLREQNEALNTAYSSAMEEKARLRDEIGATGAENAALRSEIASLRAENAALRDEREAIELLDAALERVHATRQAADVAMRVSKRENGENPADLARTVAEPAVERAAPGTQRDAERPVMEQPEAAETDLAEEPMVEVVLSLSAVLLARIDEAIDARRWQSRDEFARMAFSDAIDTQLPAPGGGDTPARGAVTRKHLGGARRGAPAQD